MRRSESLRSSTRRPIRVALFAASPIPYRVPLHQRVAADPHIDFTAIFASNGGIRPIDAGYSAPIAWDTNLLDGYKAVFLNNANRNPIDGGFFAYRDMDLVRALYQGKYDVLWLWGYNYLSHQLALLTQRLLSRPVIFHEEQHLLDPRPLWKIAAKRLGLPLMFRGSKALYIGSQNYRWFRHYGVPPDDLHFAPYSVDNRRLRAVHSSLRPQKLELRRRFGIPDDAGPVIVCVARLIPKKQPLMLLKAFGFVRSTRKCALLLVGSGELEGAIRAEVQRGRIPDVFLAGFLNQGEVAEAYAAADIFALPSKARETWAVAVNEAMNFSLPVVISDKVGCGADLVTEGANGYIVPHNSPRQLADRLARLVDSQEMRSQFGRESVARIDSWNYEVATVGVLNAIADATGRDRWTGLSSDVAAVLAN